MSRAAVGLIHHHHHQRMSLRSHGVTLPCRPTAAWSRSYASSGFKGEPSVVSLKHLYSLAQQPCTPLSLTNMYKYANANSTNYKSQRLRNAQFLHRELPIRIAQRAVDLMTLPHGLNQTEPVRHIVSIYLSYLEQFRNFPLPANEIQELAFTDLLRPMVLDRSSIPTAVAQGLKSLTSIPHISLSPDPMIHHRLQEMEDALYRFFTARIGLRLLTEHHILSCIARRKESEELRIRQSYLENVPLAEDTQGFFWGCIKDNCDPALEARRVAEQVVEHCKKCYGLAPEIQVLDCTSQRFTSLPFTYVPHHLHYMLAELLKNSCRATIRRRFLGKVIQEDHSSLHHLYEGKDNTNKGIVSESSASLPPIRVVVVKGAEDVTIKIADQGGGVARSILDKMWTFAHSTFKDDTIERNTDMELDEFTGGTIRGFGLPLARIYARYFGGDLTLKSMEGYGVDAYIYLPVLGSGCENLPQRVLLSPSSHEGNLASFFHGSLSSSSSSSSSSSLPPIEETSTWTKNSKRVYSSASNSLTHNIPLQLF